MQTTDIHKAVEFLRQGKIISYPTEAVYGLGCDPFNSSAVMRLLQIKKRSVDKGLILVASDWEQISALTQPIEPRLLANVLQSWPGPFTWVFPINPKNVPKWIHGNYSTIALRVSAHPIVQMLCDIFGGPIVSTSANIQGYPAARNAETVLLNFADQVDFIVNGQVGEQMNPTKIRDVITGEIIRP